MPTVEKQRGKSPRRKRRAKKKGVVDRIGPIDFEGRGIKITVYGRSGTGKTQFWSTFPGKILAVVCSGGKDPGELITVNTPELRKKIDQVVLSESDELAELVQMQKEENRYATMVLDHVTDFQNLLLKEVLGIDEVPQQMSWGMAKQEQYGQVSLKIKTHLADLFSLPGNVVCIAQQRNFNTDEEAEGQGLDPFICPALMPSVVSWLLPASNYTVQTFIRNKVIQKKTKLRGKTRVKTVTTDEVEYCIRTAPDPVYATKFRKPKEGELPQCIVDPSYDKIMEIIKGK